MYFLFCICTYWNVGEVDISASTVWWDFEAEQQRGKRKRFICLIQCGRGVQKQKKAKIIQRLRGWCRKCVALAFEWQKASWYSQGHNGLHAQYTQYKVTRWWLVDLPVLLCIVAQPYLWRAAHSRWVQKLVEPAKSERARINCVLCAYNLETFNFGSIPSLLCRKKSMP